MIEIATGRPADDTERQVDRISHLVEPDPFAAKKS